MAPHNPTADSVQPRTGASPVWIINTQRVRPTVCRVIGRRGIPNLHAASPSPARQPVGGGLGSSQAQAVVIHPFSCPLVRFGAFLTGHKAQPIRQMTPKREKCSGTSNFGGIGGVDARGAGSLRLVASIEKEQERIRGRCPVGCAHCRHHVAIDRSLPKLSLGPSTGSKRAPGAARQVFFWPVRKKNLQAKKAKYICASSQV